MLVDTTDQRLLDFGAPTAELDQAANAASRQLREAMDEHYVAPDDLASFPATAEGTEVRDLVAEHGVALTAEILSSKSGNVSRRVAIDANRARRWIRAVREGKIDLQPLPRQARTTRGRHVVVVGENLPDLKESFFDTLSIVEGA